MTVAHVVAAPLDRRRLLGMAVASASVAAAVSAADIARSAPAASTTSGAAVPPPGNLVWRIESTVLHSVEALPATFLDRMQRVLPGKLDEPMDWDA